jgi:hypothetical protein
VCDSAQVHLLSLPSDSLKRQYYQKWYIIYFITRI